MGEKQKMLIGIDESEHSFYALEWILNNFFTPPSSSNFKLLIVHAKITPATVLGLAGPGSMEVMPLVEMDLKKTADRVIKKAQELCRSKSMENVQVEVMEGDARNIMCDAVEKHKAAVLVLGSHGYGAFKRAVLGSVSDYCSHHAHCNVMIVKKPHKPKN